MATEACIRPAEASEEELLARIFYNSFRLNWDVNWWQSLSSPLSPVPVVSRASDEGLSGPQLSRLNFYRATIRFMFQTTGSCIDVYHPAEAEQPVAFAIWLPANVRPSVWDGVCAGWLWALLGLGLTATWRFVRTQLSRELIWPQVLAPLHRRESSCAYLELLVTDPEHAGHGYAVQLLKLRLQQHEEQASKVPVLLETASDYAQKIYERLGFRELSRKRFVLKGVDAQGLKAPGECLEPSIRYMLLDPRGQEGQK